MSDSPAPFVFDKTGEAKRVAPATARNRDAISAVLKDILPESGAVLEVASGTGEHIVHFAGAFPHIIWHPSDYDDVGLASIAAWIAESGLSNIEHPIRIDASAANWPIDDVNAILCINMIHIAPWSACEGLFAGAGRLLRAGSPLFLYGPFREADVPLTESNQAFDASLKARDSAWGLRYVEDIVPLAARHGLYLVQRLAMPANNLSLVFRKISD